MKEWLNSFIAMWQACHNPDSPMEIVRSADIERLIELAKKGVEDE